MKKGRVGHVFLFFALAILLSSPFVFAGFGDWWAKITGRATSGDANVSVSIGNTAPVIFYVEAISTVAPFENSGRQYVFKFNASDVDGTANLNNASGWGRFNLSGTFRDNSSCVQFGACSATNCSYVCTINLTYYDEPTTWGINVSLADNNGARAYNYTTTFDYDVLHAITTSPSTIAWATVGVNDTNTTADNNITINNTGNDASLTVNVTSYDLGGYSTPSEAIGANNLSVGNTTSNDCFGESGSVRLSNATSLQVTNTLINRGLNWNDDIVFCLHDMEPYLTSQDYNTTTYGYGDWVIATIT